MIILFEHQDMTKSTFIRLQFRESSCDRVQSYLMLFSSSYIYNKKSTDRFYQWGPEWDIAKSLKISFGFNFVSLPAILVKFWRDRWPVYTFQPKKNVLAIILIRFQILGKESYADRQTADGRTLAKSFCFCFLIKNIYTCLYLSRLFLNLHPLMTKVSIPFLNQPHRGYISFVNTCGTHRNVDLRPYVPWRHSISAKF